MSTLVRRADLLDVELPKAVWSRSGRPTLGRISRTLFASTLVLLGLAMPWPAVSFGLLIAGVAGFVLIPVITDLIIERGEGAFRRATAADADAKLASLDQRVLISAFAPDAWVTLQRARLQLAKGDGRAAAQALADTARIIGQPDHPELVAAQARALLLAGDRAGARTHLSALAERGELSPRARLDLGVIMLGEAGNAEAAREHLQAAYDGLDGHPQAAAALAVALARADQSERAMELLAEAEAKAADGDELAADSIKKARKALRPAREAAKKKRRKG
ncbi:MAG: hypothetical protein H6712_27945 [Myxococcales bacterium]|nr:hypothetical protein [Myxococcales bacterium]MCB9717713.1 hypothetical protein [Myxococcales bacterium]